MKILERESEKSASNLIAKSNKNIESIQTNNS